ncbi:MAG: fumarylacetoacetase [Sphingomonas sp.]
MTFLDHTHDPHLRCWVPGAHRHPDFPVQNLPLGIFSVDGDTPRPGVAIGDYVLDLGGIAGLLPAAAAGALANRTLNALLALPSADRRGLRHRISALLCEDSPLAQVSESLVPAHACRMHLPATIGDYTDFYVGIHHATNVGRLFRPDQPLLPNYKYVPIGYHGRASSIRVSGQPVARPYGQRKAADQAAPIYGATGRLDYELELGVWISGGNPLGTAIAIEDAAEHIAGLCLLNDWSARDFQAWEYQPLGPFLAKNFLTTISPWIVTAEALVPFRTAQPARPKGDPAPLPYLFSEEDQARGGLAIELEVAISTKAMRAAGEPAHRLAASHASHMYWTIAQMVTHHSANGCNLRAADLLGTGTISSPDDTGLGSMLELTRGGAQPLVLPNGETRSFLENGDEIALSARAQAEGFVGIGFGPCVGRVTG